VAASNKLDPRARQLLAAVEGSAVVEDLPTEVSVLIQGEGAFSDEQLETLREEGARVRTVAGDVLTAGVPVAALGRIAEHGFVVRLELSGPLYPEEGESSVSLADVE
jgi:hypothetical protein